METPPLPPEITAEQVADLRCLGLALYVAESTNGRHPPTVRFYLDRLRRADPSRDWKLLAPKISPDITYGEFMGEMNRCADVQYRASKGRRRGD